MASSTGTTAQSSHGAAAAAHLTDELELPTGGTFYSFNKPVIPDGIQPSGRGGASVVYVDNKMVFFGGHFFEGDNKFTYLDETWVLDVEKLKWRKINCNGQIPGPRYGHSAQLIGSRMFIFGGKGPSGVLYKDVFFLDLETWIWVSVKAVSAGPSPRFFQACETVGRKIVIHGGWDNDEVLNDLWIFNTDSFSWMQPRMAGFAPTPRYGHTISLAPDGRLFVLGGVTLDPKTSIPKYNDDIRVLDTETMIWTRPRVDGHNPTGRFGHTSTVIDDKIVMFGGWGRGGCQTRESVHDNRAYSVQVLDTKSMQWWVPRKITKKPIPHLYNHSAARMGPDAASIILCGGFDGRQANSDFIVINLEQSE